MRRSTRSCGPRSATGAALRGNQMAITSRIVRVTLSDRDGGKGFSSFRLSSLDSLTDALTAALSTLVPAIHGVSDGIASVVTATIRSNDSSAGAGGDSLIDRRCIVFWRNTDDYLASIIIPALADTIDSTDGYIDADIPDLSVFDDLTAALDALGASDTNNIPINGTVIAAALIV
jgi:hypothetical protein